MRTAGRALLLAGVLARFWQLDARSLWFDEAYGVERAAAPTLAGTFRGGPLMEPPVYYTVLHGWLRQGTNDVTARALSAVCSSAALTAAWRLLPALWPDAPATGLAVFALMALSPYEVLYAQEARGYAMLEALTLAALLALLAAIGGGSRARLAWPLWAFTCATAGLVHYLALAWIPAQLAWLWLNGRARRWCPRAAGWGLVAAVPALGWAVMVRPAIAAAVGSSVGPVSPGAYGVGLVQLFGAGAWVPRALDRPAVVLFAALGLLGAGVALARTRRGGGRPGDAAVLALGILPPLLLYAGHLAGAVPSPKIRYAGFAHAFLLAACASGAAALPRGGRRAALALLLALEGAGTVRYLEGGFPDLDLPPVKMPFRDAAAAIAARAGPGDAVVAVDLAAALPLRRYLPAGLPQAFLDADIGQLPAESVFLGRPSTLTDLAAAHARLWLVAAPLRYASPPGLPGWVVAGLRARGARPDEAVAGVPGIWIQCWRMPLR